MKSESVVFCLRNMLFFCIRSVITKDSFYSILQCCRLSHFLFGLGLNLIHLTILSPPLMNSSVAVWTHWTAGAHINTLWVCLLKAGCQIVLWTKGTCFLGEWDLTDFDPFSLLLVLGALIACNIWCANRYRLAHQREMLVCLQRQMKVMMSSFSQFITSSILKGLAAQWNCIVNSIT